jgi:uncharacterized glyoxalase superfamily protein PhnB
VTADPFEALRADTSPIHPAPAFADRLRERLVTLTRQEPTMSLTATPASTSTITITPYLVVDGAAAAIDFYVAVFGAVEQHRLVSDEDGRIGHAEIAIGTSRVMLADEYPEAGAISPTTRGGSSTSFTVEVADVDTVFARAIALGGVELRPVTDQFYGHRQGTFRDPFGHQWSVSTPLPGFDDATYAANSAEVGYHVEGELEPVTEHEHQVRHHDRGDLFYFTLPTKDLARAQAFFGALLGWQFAAPDAGHVENIAAPPGGLHADAEHIDLWFVVADIHAAAEQVRALGGTAQEPVLHDSGWDVECTDDQGTRFHLSVPAAKYTR